MYVVSAEYCIRCTILITRAKVHAQYAGPLYTITATDIAASYIRVYYFGGNASFLIHCEPHLPCLCSFGLRASELTSNRKLILNRHFSSHIFQMAVPKDTSCLCLMESATLVPDPVSNPREVPDPVVTVHWGRMVNLGTRPTGERQGWTSVCRWGEVDIENTGKLINDIGSILNPLAGKRSKDTRKTGKGAKTRASRDWRSFYLSQYD